MLKSILFALVLTATTAGLPALPKNLVQVNELTGQCGTQTVLIKVYASPTGKEQGRYSTNGREFSVFIPPLVFALRADGQVNVFNPEETGEDVCETLAKSQSKVF